MAFGLIIAVTRSSDARIIGNSYVPKDLPKEGRREISRGQGEGGFDRRPFNVRIQTLSQTL
jgi:hypothetical protein